MRAVVVDRWCEAEDLKVSSNVPIPELKTGTVLVNVKFAGANFYDILMVQGKYQFKPPFPFIPGTEFAGTVAAVASDVKQWSIGQQVYGFAQTGAFAEKMVVSSFALRAVPNGMSLQEASGFSMTYPTSYAGLVFRGNLKAGETLLVHAAAGGVGIAAVQIGKALGARVIGTVGSNDKIDVVKKAGAEEVINYNTQDFVAEVKRLTDGRGADVIYDPVGGPVTDKSLSCIAWGGRLIIVGFANGEIPAIKTNRILLKSCAVVGLFWGSYALYEPAKIRETFDTIERMYREGKLHPVVCDVFSLDNLKLGLQKIAARKTYGKLIISVGEEKAKL